MNKKKKEFFDKLELAGPMKPSIGFAYILFLCYEYRHYINSNDILNYIIKSKA